MSMRQITVVSYGKASIQDFSPIDGSTEGALSAARTGPDADRQTAITTAEAVDRKRPRTMKTPLSNTQASGGREAGSSHHV